MAVIVSCVDKVSVHMISITVETLNDSKGAASNLAGVMMMYVLPLFVSK